MPPTPPTNRAFLSQDAVDRWLTDDRISIDGDVLSLSPDGPAFRLESAVLFRIEVSSGEDALGLCGKVKTLEAVQALSGEHVPGSVVLNDSAYEVVDGFVGHLLAADGQGSQVGLAYGKRALAALTATTERVGS
jgi:hypothetical protein